MPPLYWDPSPCPGLNRLRGSLFARLSPGKEGRKKGQTSQNGVPKVALAGTAGLPGGCHGAAGEGAGRGGVGGR